MEHSIKWVVFIKSLVFGIREPIGKADRNTKRARGDRIYQENKTL